MSTITEYDSGVEAETAALEHPGAVVIRPRGATGKWKVRVPDPAIAAIDALTTAVRAQQPVAAPVEITLMSLRDNLMAHQFAPYRFAWGKYYPLRATSALIAEGKTGKSTLSMSQQLHGAAGGLPYLDAPTIAGLYVYVSCEDDFEIVERRAQRILTPFTPEQRAKALANFKVIDGVGKGLQFVMSSQGIAGIAPTVDRIIEAVRAVAGSQAVVHVACDTVSRLNGGEENATEVMAAVEQAGSRIAQALDCAVSLLHHTSKAVAREGIADAHAGRGAASFGDNCRSVLRLMPLTPTMVSQAKLEGLDRVEVERGDVLKLVHAALNIDRKSDPIYLRRTSDGLLERIAPTVRTEAQTADAHMAGLVKWFTGGAGPFTITGARDAWLKWTKMSRRAAQTFLEEAVRDGRLMEHTEKRNGKVQYVPAADALTRQVHVDNVGWLDE